MSQSRSESVREEDGVSEAELLGMAVQLVTMERREAYLPVWSGVRAAAGGGGRSWRGREKGF